MPSRSRPGPYESSIPIESSSDRTGGSLSGVAVRIRGKRPCARERAEAVLVPTMHEAASAVPRGYGHPADRINRENADPGSREKSAVKVHWVGDVSEPRLPQRLQLHPVNLSRRIAGGLSQEHVVPSGGSGNPGGGVDGRPKPVRAPLHRGSGVHTDMNDRKTWLGVKGLDNLEAKSDGSSGLSDPHHHGITDGLNLFATVYGQKITNRLLELAGEVGRLLVTVSLGEGSESRQIGKEEGLVAHTPEATLGMSAALLRARWVAVTEGAD